MERKASSLLCLCPTLPSSLDIIGSKLSFGHHGGTEPPSMNGGDCLVDSPKPGILGHVWERLIAWFFCSFVLLACLHSTAYAATLSLTGGVLTFTDSTGTQNNAVTIDVQNGAYVITDTAGAITNVGTFSANWSGFGTTSVLGPTSEVTQKFQIDQQGGTNNTLTCCYEKDLKQPATFPG